MIVVYRKRKDGSRWHFHTACPGWPETNYIQVQFGQLPAGERVCEECVRLESQMFPRKKMSHARG